ncbi:SPOR domain-containing protein [Ferrovibrio terrae]|uniref:SPOR domain-containing protein n=1 Tax=Ferrovibrio terrae TaxID=2594003 RepID=UPI0031383725
MSDLRGDRNMRPVPGETASAPGIRSPKRLITAGIALGAVAAFGVGIWFAYDQGVKRGASGAPPLIRADQGPTKVAPENPGGMQVPNQDKQIYERLPGNTTANTAGQTERLLPPQERPSATPTQPNVATSPAVSVPTRPAQSVPNQSAAVPNRTDAPSPAPIPPAPAAPGQPQPVAPRTAAAPATPAPTQTPPAATARAAAPAPTVTATPGGSARIQLASLKDQAAATATWNQLQKKFPEVLGGLQPTYERVEIADKGTFIRLQAGPLKDRAEAQSACNALAAKNQGCIVVGR